MDASSPSWIAEVFSSIWRSIPRTTSRRPTFDITSSSSKASRTSLARFMSASSISGKWPRCSLQIEIGPSSHVRWPACICKGAVAIPSRGGRPVLSGELVDLELRLMEKARQKRNEVRYLGQYRDGLLIAFLALVPIRLRNLADLALGRTLIKIGSGWMVRFPPETTKTHRTLEYEWSTFLVPALEDYLTTYRPLPIQRDGRWNREAGESLWISLDGSPMPFGAISDRLTRQTRAAFGYAIRAHAFRHAAVTTLALDDPDHVLAGAPLLGHTSFSTTEQSYNVAKSLEASRAFGAVTIRPPSSGRKGPRS